MNKSAPIEESLAPARKPHAKRWWIVAAVLFAPLIAMAAIWFGPRPRVTCDHVRLVRGPDGVLAAEAPPSSGIQFEGHAGKLEAHDNLGSSCVSSSGDGVRFACRRLAVLNRSEHLMMRRLSDGLVENLKRLSYVDQIDYYPPGVEPEEGQLAPDVAIVLELKSWKESGIVWQSDVDAEIAVTAGNRLACSNAFSRDSLTPPVVTFAWQGRLHHRSTTRGVTSSAAKYKQVAEHCAKQIGDALGKQFGADLEKYGPLDKLPQAFYPAYNCAQELPFRSVYPLERLAIWHGLMNHCDATWRLTTDHEPNRVLGTIQKLLERVGWKVADQAGPPHARMRMARGSAVLEVFSERQDGPLPAVETQAAEPPAGRVFYVHYLDRMTEKELAGAVDRAVGENAPLDALIPFRHSWTADQCRRILGRLDARPPSDPDGWLALAELYQRLQELPKARDAVLKARALEPTVPDANGLPGRIEGMAKSLGDPSLAKRPLDAGLLKDAGFVRIQPDAKVPDREVAADEPACYYAIGRDGKPQTIAVRLKSAKSSGGAGGQLAFVQWSEGSKSWGTGGMRHLTHVEGLGMVDVTATPLSDAQRFRVSCRVSPAAAAPTTTPVASQR